MNVPKLRFKEFTDEWQKKPLKDIVYSNIIEVPKPTTDYIRLGIRSHCKGTFHELVKIENILSADKMYIVPKDNIILNITFAWEQAIAITDKNDEGKYVSNRFPTFAFKNNQLPAFYKYIISQNRLKYDLNVASPGGAGRNRVLNKKLFLLIPINIPSFEEQKKIAKFLSIVDKKILNLENIITNLENQQKGFLQQIFNQELRFKDENGNNYPDWEEKLFSDTFSFLSTNSYSRTDMNEVQGTVKNIHYGDVLIKFNHIIDLSKHQLPYLIDYNSIPEDILKEQLKKQLIKNGDIVIADTAEDYTAGKVCEVINVNDNLVVSGLHTMLCRPKPDLFSLGFLGYFMNSYTYHHQLLRLITGTKVCSIIKKEIIKTKILIPCLEEQTKIADFLSAFDRKIDNQKAQLEHWKQIKKGLLQQMFV